MALPMFVILPSENETGTLSNLALEFETARFYTIAIIIEDTLADTKIKQGFQISPSSYEWGAILKKLKIEVAVANRIKPETLTSLQSAGIRVVKGAKGLVGDMVDWIADVGVDEFAEKVAALNPQPDVQSKPDADKAVEPVVQRNEAPGGAGSAPKPGQPEKKGN